MCFRLRKQYFKFVYFWHKPTGVYMADFKDTDFTKLTSFFLLCVLAICTIGWGKNILVGKVGRERGVIAGDMFLEWGRQM